MKMQSNCKTQLASSQRLFSIFLFLLNQYWTVYILIIENYSTCNGKFQLQFKDKSKTPWLPLKKKGIQSLPCLGWKDHCCFDIYKMFELEFLIIIVFNNWYAHSKMFEVIGQRILSATFWSLYFFATCSLMCSVYSYTQFSD